LNGLSAIAEFLVLLMAISRYDPNKHHGLCASRPRWEVIIVSGTTQDHLPHRYLCSLFMVLYCHRLGRVHSFSEGSRWGI